MPQGDLNVMIGGAAGQGIKTAGLVLARVCTRAGLSVFGNVEYPSVIRGDHNSFQLTISERWALASDSRLDVLLALDRMALELHRGEMRQGGAILAEEADAEDAGGRPDGPEALLVRLPLQALAKETGGGPASVNVIGAAAVLGLLRSDFEGFAVVLRDTLKKLGREALERTLAAARKAFDLAADRSAGKFGTALRKVEAPRRMLLTGNDALCLGAVRAGCKVYAGYPMTPASSLLTTLARKEREFGLAVRHAEDEIAAAGIAVGAAYAGARAMVGTSGGGFCLMTEHLGLAGMTETPVVFVVSQRPGPSTGLPTRTEQGDLLFVLTASQGEFPRIVIAPGDPEECFRWGFEAFNLAERFQTPAILLLDKHLSESYFSCEPFDASDLAVDRGTWADARAVEQGGGVYRRHAFTPSGVSPRLRPGTPGAVTITTGDEHDEEGHITEDAELRARMTEKRLRKLDALDVSRTGFTLHGDPCAPLTVVGWGSTKGVIFEALGRLAAEGVKANFLQVLFMEPFPSEGVRRTLEAAKRILLVENNATGQLGAWIARKTGLWIEDRLLKFDGRMFLADELAESIRGIL
jgi:2-oxoglutarate ferredoxin oxidoreductase subunit alpha